MQEKILELISLSQQRGLSFEEIQSKLALNSQTDFNEAFKILNSLIDSFVLALNNKQRYVEAKYMDFYVGVLRLNKKGFGFVVVDDLVDDIYVGSNDLNGALDKDRVCVKHNAKDNSGKVIKIMERGTKTIVGTIYKNKKGYFLLKPDTSKISLLVRVEANTPNLVEGLKVKGEIIAYTNDFLEVKIVEIIGHIQDAGVDVLSKLIEYDIYPEFNDMVLRETAAISDSVSAEQLVNRRDLRSTFVCTIDGDDSKDFDDAISIEKCSKGYKLGVHIADVSYYVTKNSALDVEAYKRGTSVYVVDRVVPMLPFQLSNGICSLNPNVDRLTLSCEMIFDENGEVIDYEIFPSVINSKLRMTYNNVNKILEQDEEMLRTYHDYLDKFYLMHELSLKIRAKRYGRGCIDFDTSESKFRIDEKGNVLDVYKRERFEAERIIEDFMIAANECVAKHMRFLDLPFVYRIHENPDPKRVREFASVARLLGFAFSGNPNNVYVNEFQRLLDNAKDSEEFPILSTFMLRCMSKARYDVNCVGHFGLASENYTHFTSPIRRYPDLMVHRQLRKYLFSGFEPTASSIQADLIDMANSALHASERERAAVDAERDIEAMKKAEFFEGKINEVYEGIITSVNNFGMFVELDNTVEGLVHISKLHDDYYHFNKERQVLQGERTGNIYRLGMRVKIKVKSASKVEGTIDFEIINGHNKSRSTFKSFAKRDYSTKASSSKIDNKVQKATAKKDKSGKIKPNKVKPTSKKRQSSTEIEEGPFYTTAFKKSKSKRNKGK